MTTTRFFTPTNIQNVTVPNEITGQNSIDWVNLNRITGNDSYTETVSGLYTIPGLWMEKFLSNTSQVWLTSFNIPSNSQTLTGIEFQLNIQRAARIQDLLIQLTLGGELIGNNYASTINPVQSDMYTADTTAPLNPIGNYNIYGSSTDLWGTELTSSTLTDPTFGIVISFKSNQEFPMRDLAYVNQVALRMTYA
jgi:hypothetical protein